MLRRVFSWRRYARSRELFRSPLAAHLRLAAVRTGSRPHRLDFRDGGQLSFANPRGFRPLWDVVLAGDYDFEPECERDTLVLRQAGQPVGIRPDTSDTNCFREVYLDDVYGLNALDRPLRTVIDLGGNTGMFSLRVAAHAERVICVEAVEANLAVARRNLERAGLASKVTLLQRAAAARSGEKIRIYLSGDATSTFSTSPGFAELWGGLAGWVEVESIGLADLFERYGVERCCLLKCDVEGAEYAIFEAAPLELLRRIDWLKLEIHLAEPELSLARFELLARRLVDAGFALEHEPPSKSDGALKRTFMLEGRRESDVPLGVSRRSTSRA